MATTLRRILGSTCNIRKRQCTASLLCLWANPSVSSSATDRSQQLVSLLRRKPTRANRFGRRGCVLSSPPPLSHSALSTQPGWPTGSQHGQALLAGRELRIQSPHACLSLHCSGCGHSVCHFQLDSRTIPGLRFAKVDVDPCHLKCLSRFWSTHDVDVIEERLAEAEEHWEVPPPNLMNGSS